MRPSIRPKRRYCSNSFRISAMFLKLGGVMHNTMKQIAFQNIWLCYANFCAFHRTLKFSVIGLESKPWARSEGWWFILGNVRKSHHGLEIGGMMQCTMRRITTLIEMATLSQCSHFPISAGRGCCRSLNVLCVLETNKTSTLHTMLSIMVESLD